MNKLLLLFYKDHLTRELLPFWKRAVDEEHGGVYTCFNNSGEKLLTTDKYTWSQGRFLWLAARLTELSNKGLIAEEPRMFGEWAQKTVRFLRDHVFLPNGNCAFLLSRTGERKEPVAGGGYDTSFYADCFVVLGFSEYARVFGDKAVLAQALALYESIARRLSGSGVRSDPYPVPSAYRAHGYAMIMLHVAEQLACAAAVVDASGVERLETDCAGYLSDIMEYFYQPDGQIAEMVTTSAPEKDSILARHRNPGHTLECMWFVIRAAERLGRGDYIEKALTAIKMAYELGWDAQYGGLLRFVDRSGGRPDGFVSGDAYERLIVDTWDNKLWWPHSEALYATLLAHSITGDKFFLDLYYKTHDYVFKVFPHPDGAVGEWIQIRDRQGEPVEKLVALPVKDPYHIIRNAMLLIELLAGECHE